ncbi:hypothetical protein QJQ45_009485 [Haematococcus lacustris]|nr:hypothetical protein QJQ45_009485 [Haematococcus lacustris]
MQRIGESRWSPLELCYWPEQGALPARGKEYPELGYKRLRDRPPKAQQQQQQPVARVIKRGGVIAKRGRSTALSALQEEQLRDLVDAAGRRVQPQTYMQRPDRIFNMDETGFQTECHERVLATTGAKHVFQSAASNSLGAATHAWPGVQRMAASCQLTGFVYAGKQLSHSALGAIHFYPQSSIILKKGTHMMDGRLFPKLFPKQIPGGVSRTNRALLVLGGHASRFSNNTKEAARVHGFDLVILPAQCTSFLQPWDQLFGSVKAHYQKLLGHADFLAGAEGFNPSPSQIISLVDTAMHYSVGFSMQPLQQAYEKTGLYPPNKDNIIAAATASMEGGKQQPAFEP